MLWNLGLIAKPYTQTVLQRILSVVKYLPSSFHVFLETREAALVAPDLVLLLFTVCCSLWFGLRGRNLKTETMTTVIQQQQQQQG